MTQDVKGLVERLQASDYHDPACPFRTHCYCDDSPSHDRVSHPDALEAATELLRLEERVKAEADDRSFIWRWIERGLYDPQVSAIDALKTLAHYPGAPWNKGRWDVDHKPYANKLYADFPKARATLETDHAG